MIININDDLDFEKIRDSGECFRVKRFEDDTFRFITGDKVLYIKENCPGEFEVSCSKDEWDSVWADYFDLGRNYSEIRNRLSGDDDYSQKAIDFSSGIRILKQDPWETLVSFIISQRKSIPSISSAIEKISACFGRKIETEREVIYTFPDASEFPAEGDERLASCSLGYRLPYVEKAAAEVRSGSLDLEALRSLNDKALLDRLMKLYGVGVKVANCVCLFAYGRTSMAPIDTWIARVIDSEYGGTDPFPQYGEYAGILQQYIFYYARKNS
ncbi:MAG: DNA-3-methyladenine glycosylase 2 family protein [Lachnospiraceae bacterium]|nr:DNA-3-methyladenine glycosylase 2 family protein [Lachnospiraceae bacterium]